MRAPWRRRRRPVKIRPAALAADCSNCEARALPWWRYCQFCGRRLNTQLPEPGPLAEYGKVS